MELEVICAHLHVRQYANEEGVVLFEMCATCGLDANTEVLAGYPGEMLPWWEHKPAAKKRIDSCRPSINALHDLKLALREQSLLLSELLAWEVEIGEPQSQELLDELAEVEAQRREHQT